jgi:hypothetical protein
MKAIDKEGVEWLVEMDVLQPNIEKTRTMKTAVEWLYQHLFPKQLDGFSEEEWSKIDVAFEQAKEMEKEQHKQTWLDSTAQFDNAAEMTYKKDFEQYYNETFKNQE